MWWRCQDQNARCNEPNEASSSYSLQGASPASAPVHQTHNKTQTNSIARYIFKQETLQRILTNPDIPNSEWRLKRVLSLENKSSELSWIPSGIINFGIGGRARGPGGGAGGGATELDRGEGGPDWICLYLSVSFSFLHFRVGRIWPILPPPPPRPPPTPPPPPPPPLQQCQLDLIGRLGKYGKQTAGIAGNQRDPSQINQVGNPGWGSLAGFYLIPITNSNLSMNRLEMLRIPVEVNSITG